MTGLFASELAGVSVSGESAGPAAVESAFANQLDTLMSNPNFPQKPDICR